MSPIAKYTAAHGDPKGAGDARPSALQIITDEGLQGALKGKVVFITGCSSGIGVETARALHATGADLYLTVRDMQKGQHVVKDILTPSNSNRGKLELLHLELDSLQSVRDCAEHFLNKSCSLNILVNNAGVMCCPEGQTKDGFEAHFGTNHLAHFLLFQLLKPALLKASTPDFNSRVVSVSSISHMLSPIVFDDLDLKKSGYHPHKAYAQSKTANIYLANEIERQYSSQGLHATSVMPGLIMTELLRHLDPAVIKSWDAYGLTPHFKNAEQGAATTVWAAVGKDWEGKGGKYLADCSVPGPNEETDKLHGYAPYAYDEEAAQKLWSLSLQLVGLPQQS